jgi:hypothetical protein
MRKHTLHLEETVRPTVFLFFCLPIFLAPVTATAAEGIGSGFVLKAAFECKLQQGKLVCGKTKKNADDDDDDDDNQKPKPAKTKDCKKARCEPGFVVLDKPNKYGACCEAREGLPPPKAAEPEQCKFPGEIGTPPNCTCPSGTEFMGYKGCVKTQKWCCMGVYPDGTVTGPDCGAPKEAVRKITSSAVRNGVPVKPDSITCDPAN